MTGLVAAEGPILAEILAATYDIWNEGLDRNSYARYYAAQRGTSWGRQHLRRTALVRDGFPEGCAADDHAALVFEGPELREVVSAREGATAYRVTLAGVEPLEARRLS